MQFSSFSPSFSNLKQTKQSLFFRFLKKKITILCQWFMKIIGISSPKNKSNLYCCRHLSTLGYFVWIMTDGRLAICRTSFIHLSKRFCHSSNHSHTHGLIFKRPNENSTKNMRNECRWRRRKTVKMNFR